MKWGESFLNEREYLVVGLQNNTVEAAFKTADLARKQSFPHKPRVFMIV